MISHNKFLRTILATTSTFALFMGVASEVGAGAAAVQRTTTNSHTGGQSWGGGASTDTFTSGNSVLLDQAADTIGINSVVNVAGIDLNGFTPTGAITASSTGATLGSVGNGEGAIPLTLQDGVTLTLSGTPTIGGEVSANDYSGLGEVTLGHTGGGTASTLNITGSTGGVPTYYFAINSFTGAANPGILNINNAVLFQSATIGGTVPLSAINITNGGTWQAGLTSAKATNINLTSGTSVVRLWGGTVTGNISNTSGGVGTTGVSINGGDTVLAGSIGAGTSANTWISALNFESNNKLTISSAGGARSVYAPIINAAGADGHGVLALSGTNNITLFDNVGTSGATLSCISFTGDNKLIINSTSSARDIYSQIQNDGTSGQGTVSTSGSNSITFHNFVGQRSFALIGTIDLTANTGGTITFNKYVDATTIKVGARPVVFSSTTDHVSGNIQLTNTESQVTFSNPNSLGVYTGNITNTSGSEGSTKVNISGADVTFVGDIGTNTMGLHNLYFATDNTLTISGNHDIYAYITSSSDGQGTLKVSGGTTTLHYNVGSYNGSMVPTAALKAINVNDQTLVIDSTLGNFYVAGQITTTTNGSGTLTLQGANSVNLFNDIGNSNSAALAAINVNTNTTLYSGTVRATAINVASGKTLTIDSTSGTRAITGTIDGAADNVGTVVFTRLGNNAITINSNIGTTHPLNVVRFSNFNGGAPAALSHDVRATTLDLVGTSIVELSANATNITNFTSSSGASYVYYSGTDVATLNRTVY